MPALQYGGTSLPGTLLLAGHPSMLYSHQFAIDGLRTALLQRPGKEIALFDSNPFEPRLQAFYREIFSAIDQSMTAGIAVYLDPSAFARHLGEALESIAHGGYWLFFSGRDAVVEEEARLMGTREGSRIKGRWIRRKLRCYYSSVR